MSKMNIRKSKKTDIRIRICPIIVLSISLQWNNNSLTGKLELMWWPEETKKSIGITNMVINRTFKITIEFQIVMDKDKISITQEDKWEGEIDKLIMMCLI